MTDDRPMLVSLSHDADGNPTLTYPIRDDSPDEAIKALLRVFSADELCAALDELEAES